MDLNDNSNVYGSVHGLWSGQHDRVDELNERISNRQLADHPLQPNFSPRSVSTKYSHFPIIERRASPTVPIQRGIFYDTQKSFCPATTNGPTATYLANVDTETILQNRHIMKQRGAEQSVYVPSSRSDLYGFSAVGRQELMGERQLLFHQHSLSTTQSDVANKLGRDRFHNNTRVQLKDL